MNMIVDPLRIRHVLQHDVAHAQRRLSEPDLEQLDRSDLHVGSARIPLVAAEFPTSLTAS